MRRIAIYKILVAALLVLVCLLISYSCTVQHKYEENQGTAKVNSQNSYAEEMKSIDDVVGASSNIIIGTVIEKEAFSDFTDKYLVSVDKNIKGAANADDIDVYETKETLKVGDKYILFLQYHESVLYPNPTYTSVNKECIIKVVDNKLIGNSRFVSESLDLDRLVQNIENSKNIAANLNKKFNIINKYETLDEQIENSDYILIITPININKSNKYVSLVTAKAEAKLKGNVSDELELILPSDIQEGKKYIVFLKHNTDILELAAREGSIISEDQTDKWEEINERF